MLHNEETYHLIEEYLKDRLSAKDKRDVEDRRSNDPEFAEMLTQYSLAKASINAHAAERLKIKVKEAYRQTKPARRLNMTWRFSIAAAIILLIGLALWRITIPGAVSHEELFAQYYSPQSITQTRSLSAENNELWTISMQAYHAGKYQPALEGFQKMKAEIQENLPEEIFLYEGICHMELGNIDSALTSFGKVSDENAVAPLAKWYTALAALKGNDPTRAKTLLEEISSSGRFSPQKRKQAKEILGKL